MSSEIRIIATEDGSQSLYNEVLNETYHSTHGALTESKYVFLKQGVDLLIDEGKGRVDIFEVGFGTGLNALLVLAYAKKYPSLKFTFTTLEPYPLPREVITKLTYDELLEGISRSDFEGLHDCDWEQPSALLENYTFTKYISPLASFDTQQRFDVVFYDAFAPSKQAEMWEKVLLSRVVSLLSDNGIFVTYCAKGQLKRDLASLNMEVETLPGPPGKKEMVRARKA